MVRNVAIVMNGVTGRMGTRQHLVRSVLAIREQGVVLPGGEVVVPDPILLGRNEKKLRSLARAHGIERWSTDLDESLADPEVEIYFDSQTTTRWTAALRAAIEAGKHVYCEKPTTTSLNEALEISHLACERSVKKGVVQDKLFLPGLLKLKRLVDGGFFGRILLVRGGFGYWVFDGDGRQAQRPSWKYREEEGGGIILDMPCHWRYVLDNLKSAYEEQCAFVQGEGRNVILMASRALAARAESPEDYAEVYGAILSQVSSPVIIHWLGEMFDPALSGYWGHRDLEAATEVCLSIIEDYAGKIDGIKVSLLDAGREVEIRRRRPDGVRMYTGDDFDYPDLILGDEQGFSHALLGIFDAIAPAASPALQALDSGDTDRYEETLAPTVPLSRHIFRPPLLQDGRRLSGLHKRPPGPLSNGWGTGGRPLGDAPLRVVRPRSQGRASARPRSRRRTYATRTLDCRGGVK